MEKSEQRTAAVQVLEEWLPRIERIAGAIGQTADSLLEHALKVGLPSLEEVEAAAARGETMLM